MAIPLTSAITGFGQFTTICINDEHKLKRSKKYDAPSSSLSLASVISLRLCPEQKTLPVAAITITFIELSLEAFSKDSESFAIKDSDKAFLFF